MIAIARKLIKNAVFKNLFIYLLSDGINRAIPFLVFPIVAYYLSTADFGLVNNFNVMIQVLGALIGMNSYTLLSVNYFGLKDKQEENFLVSNIFYLNVCAFIFVFVLVLLTHNYIYQVSGISLAWQLLGLSTIIFKTFESIYLTKVRLDENATFFLRFNLVVSIIGATMTFLFVGYFAMGYQGRFLSIVIPSIVSGSIIFFLAIRKNLLFSAFSFSTLKKNLLFCLPLLPNTVSFWLKTGFDKLLISNYIGLSANGVYSFAATLSSIFVLFSVSFNNAFTPFLYRNLTAIEKGEGEISKHALVKYSYMFLLAFAALLVIGYFFARLVVVNFFYDKYYESLRYLPLFLVFNFFNSAYQLLESYIYFKKKTKFIGLVTFLLTVFQAVLATILVKNIGVMGAALSLAFTSIVIFAIVGYVSNRIYPMPWLAFLRRSSE